MTPYTVYAEARLQLESALIKRKGPAAIAAARANLRQARAEWKGAPRVLKDLKALRKEVGQLKMKQKNTNTRMQKLTSTFKARIIMATDSCNTNLAVLKKLMDTAQEIAKELDSDNPE